MNKAKLKKALREATGCTIQHTGWTCGTCFFAIDDSLNNQDWQFVLWYRGDYNEADLENLPESKADREAIYQKIMGLIEKDAEPKIIESNGFCCELCGALIKGKCNNTNGKITHIGSCIIPTNQEVFENGEKLDDWACDFNIETEECDSNAGKEHLIEYNGLKYQIITDWNDKVYKADEEAEPIEEDN